MSIKLPKVAFYPLVVAVALAAGALAGALEIALIQRLHIFLPVIVGALAGGAVFSLADKLNLLRDDPPPLTLFSAEADEQAKIGYSGDEPLQPK